MHLELADTARSNHSEFFWAASSKSPVIYSGTNGACATRKEIRNQPPVFWPVAGCVSFSRKGLRSASPEQADKQAGEAD